MSALSVCSQKPAEAASVRLLGTFPAFKHWKAMPRTTPTDNLALHLVHRLYEATDGRPNRWKMLAGKLAKPALDLAVESGWLLVDEGGRGVCLTEAGRERVRRWRDE